HCTAGQVGFHRLNKVRWRSSATDESQLTRRRSRPNWGRCGRTRPRGRRVRGRLREMARTARVTGYTTNKGLILLPSHHRTGTRNRVDPPVVGTDRGLTSRSAVGPLASYPRDLPGG